MSDGLAFTVEDLAVDRRLADIAASFRFLLDVTPVNVDDARARFQAGEDDPPFRYRPLEDDPAVLLAELDTVDVESVTDPTLAHLVQEKRREIALQIEMLASRGTGDFRASSIELYGAVGPALLREAEAILDALDGIDPRRGDAAETLDAGAFVRLAEAELEHYRAFEPDLSCHVELRADAGGIIVTEGNLLVAPSTRLSPDRAAALLHHEIGTHVVTYVNGSHQPLRLLAVGLAGYEETQEGLAMLAEHLGGGLTASRLRQIAARVVAVHGMVEGRSFRGVHDDLLARRLPAATAFATTMRVFRSGGLTKDLVYLRGLVDLVAHLRAGHPLDVLWLGKMPLSAVPLVEQLWERGALRDPLLRPRHLDDPAARRRLDGLRDAASVLDLIER